MESVLCFYVCKLLYCTALKYLTIRLKTKIFFFILKVFIRCPYYGVSVDIAMVLVQMYVVFNILATEKCDEVVFSTPLRL